MADDIDLKKCSEFNDGRFGIPLDSSTFTNIAKFSNKCAFDAKIGVLLANLKIGARWLMTLT